MKNMAFPVAESISKWFGS